MQVGIAYDLEIEFHALHTYYSIIEVHETRGVN